jgi:hypothetical protein
MGASIMNTANLQLEGLYLTIAALARTLIDKGILAREDMDAVVTRAEKGVRNDERYEKLSPAERDVVAFPARFLSAAIGTGSGSDFASFSEVARLIGKTKGENDGSAD